MNVFLSNIRLFSLPVLITNIFDIIFGSISFGIGKGANQIKNEAELDVLTNKIIDLPDTIIDNSYFDFTEQDIDYINDKKYKLLASSPIPIPKQIVKWNL
jgi:hypothetical protein